MSHESILRQVALVGYGTKYLRGEVALEDWYRHGVFFGARLQFRALPDNALLADDFTVWLGILKESGAIRLSLHLPVENHVAVTPAAHGGDYVLVVHYTDSYQVWTVGTEMPAWCDHPVFNFEPGKSFPVFPDAAYYGGELDTYWCGETKQGVFPVPTTDWQALASSIAAELEIDVPSSEVATGPYIVSSPENMSWSQFPLFPHSNASSLAHQVLATLYREHAKFANDTHCKNESSWYKNLNEQDAAKADAWGMRLDSLILDVELCCANEYRDAADVRMHATLGRTQVRKLAARSPVPPHNPGNADDSPADAGTVKPLSTSVGIWTSRIVFIAVFAVATLFILAIANVIASFPWLAILIGLPFALYAKYKNTPE